MAAEKDVTAGDLRVTRSSLGDGTDAVAIAGDFDGLVSGLELTELMSGCVEDRRHVILDLSRTAFIDSSGLALLLRAQQRLEAVGRALVLLAPHPGVDRLLRLTGIEDILHSAATPAAAHALLSSDAARRSVTRSADAGGDTPPSAGA